MPGYAGGTVENPTYEQVSGGKTGHAEAIKIEFNPEEIKYPDLLNVFFATHDPTTLNQPASPELQPGFAEALRQGERGEQGNDVGTQYRSAIFYASDEQRQEAEREVRELEHNKVFSSPIVTELHPFAKFYEAEDYHKNYFARNPDQPYCQVVIDPKIAKLRQKFSHLLKTSP